MGMITDRFGLEEQHCASACGMRIATIGFCWKCCCFLRRRLLGSVDLLKGAYFDREDFTRPCSALEKVEEQLAVRRNEEKSNGVIDLDHRLWLRLGEKTLAAGRRNRTLVEPSQVE
ncbi:hypothetical protein BHE74_00028979 [Ensete ventricosum]|nr:hypothetical protein BHE74_00028979 [Ensete ventricosum]RZR79326.1 hypothetical protein BHM03_00005030 [Ensete ventricosum]